MIEIPRKFFSQQVVESAKTHLAEHLNIKGGELEARDGTLIDARLAGCVVKSVDDSPICVSALAMLSDCTIEGKDVLIEGQFSGTIVASGRVEFASGCIATGILNRGGEVYFHPLADLDDLRIKTLARESGAISEVKPALQVVNA